MGKIGLRSSAKAADGFGLKGRGKLYLENIPATGNRRLRAKPNNREAANFNAAAPLPN